MEAPVRISSFPRLDLFSYLLSKKNPQKKKSSIYSSFVQDSLSLCNFLFIDCIVELSIASSCRVAGLSV